MTMPNSDRLHPLIPLALTAAVVVVVVPFWPALILGAWVGLLLRGFTERLAAKLRGHLRLAAALTLILLALVLVPLGIVVASVVADAVAFVQSLLATNKGKAVLELLLSDGQDGREWSARALMDLAMSQAENAWSVLKLVAGAASKAALDVIVFFVVAWGVVVDGRRAFRWAEVHLPVPAAALRRFAAAFAETGRALLIGAGGGALAQGVAATITYLILGVPRALTLGVLTAIAAFLPAIGTTFIWAPVSIALFVAGRYGAAVALAVIGIVLIGGIDNFLRPLLARGAHLALPMYAVVLAMFGGLALLGPPGLLLGVLVLRLAKEALVIAREQETQ